MTEEQFNEIKERLSKWREERHLTYENQQAGFLGNVFEEVSEYFRAKDDLEIIDALCDITIFCFNVNDIKYSDNYVGYLKSDEVDFEDFAIISRLKFIVFGKMNMSLDFVRVSFEVLISMLEKKCGKLGFDFYKCMIETIKEIESRTGYYDNNLKKFIKDKGAYNKEDLLEKYPISKYDISEDNTHFIIFDKKGRTETFIKKWYKAHYESCRLLKC